MAEMIVPTNAVPAAPHVEIQDAMGMLATPAEFREELQRVQARIERTDCFFSVIMFDVTGPHSGGLNLDVAHTLLNRTRTSDFVGWFDRKHIGVILDGCLICSALSFGNSVCQQISKWRHPPRRATIQTFPAKYKTNPSLAHGSCKGCGTEGAGCSNDDASIHAGDPLTCPSLCIQKSGFLPSSVTVEYGTSIGTETRPPAGAGLPVWKRSMDIVISLITMVILSPVLILAALLVKVTSAGPVIFRQERVGYLGRPFVLYKFRSMSVAQADPKHEEFMKSMIAGEGDAADEPMLKEKTGGAARTTWVGRMLRNTCIDELPQLVNVLRGQMSLVGPRPPIPYEVEVYKRWHGGRFDSVPGLTGLWQVSGKNDLSFKEMARLDIQYSRHLSLWLDLKIMLRTPLAVYHEFCQGIQGEKRRQAAEADPQPE
jgi:lipopolysaccharide/colanic/teichoic acid biosynthesis glycosyltransferase